MITQPAHIPQEILRKQKQTERDRENKRLTLLKERLKQKMALLDVKSAA
jgi:hypothetical protein